MEQPAVEVSYEAKHVVFEFGPTTLPRPDHNGLHVLKRRAPRRPPLNPEPAPPKDKQDAESE